MEKSSEKDVKEIKENIRKNIHELRKGQKALDDAIKLLEILDKIN